METIIWRIMCSSVTQHKQTRATAQCAAAVTYFFVVQMFNAFFRFTEHTITKITFIRKHFVNQNRIKKTIEKKSVFRCKLQLSR